MKPNQIINVTVLARIDRRIGELTDQMNEPVDER